MSSGQAKKLYIMYILEILKKYSDDRHRLKQQDIIDIMKKDYDVACEQAADIIWPKEILRTAS